MAFTPLDRLSGSSSSVSRVAGRAAEDERRTRRPARSNSATVTPEADALVSGVADREAGDIGDEIALGRSSGERCSGRHHNNVR